jgi:hypothetical protein
MKSEVLLLLGLVFVAGVTALCGSLSILLWLGLIAVILGTSTWVGSQLTRQFHGGQNWKTVPHAALHLVWTTWRGTWRYKLKTAGMTGTCIAPGYVVVPLNHESTCLANADVLETSDGHKAQWIGAARDLGLGVCYAPNMSCQKGLRWSDSRECKAGQAVCVVELNGNTIAGVIVNPRFWNARVRMESLHIRLDDPSDSVRIRIGCPVVAPDG